MKNFYELTAELPSWKIVKMEEYKGKVVLIANTASKCWLTPQYKWLEALYEKYKDRGLVVLGFPCNQFANQEPWTDTEIKENCLLNYWVTFPIFKKVDVNRENTCEVFKYLKDKSSFLFGKKIKWNFTKFLVSSDLKIVKRFAPIVKPESLEAEIIKLLK